MGGHPRLRDLVEALLTDDPDKNFETAKKDPKKFLQSRGIELPEKCRVTVTRNTPISVSVCVGVTDFYCVSVSLPDIEFTHTTPH